MKIAIDAMGGDNGHELNVEGACLAIDEVASLEKLYLVGDEDQITNSLKRINTNNTEAESQELTSRSYNPGLKAQRLNPKSLNPGDAAQDFKPTG